MKDTKIQWADSTFNCWRGCSKISAGCTNCYADAFSSRNPKVLGVWGPNGTRVIAADAAWKEPLKWDREAKAAGKPHRVFCASLADVFEGFDTMPTESHDAVMQARKRLGQLILDTPNLTWMLLTKRPQNILPIAADMWVRFSGPSQPLPPNVWIGASVENQQAADERIPRLLRVPARVHFLSCEPLLGPVDLTSLNSGDDPCEECGEVPLINCLHIPNMRCSCCVEGAESLAWHRLDWVIVGGESGPNARPMHPKWARSLRDQCEAAGVAYFFKQWGEYAEWDGTQSPSPSCRTSDGKTAYVRVGKEKAGRVLDGKVWDEVPS